MFACVSNYTQVLWYDKCMGTKVVNDIIMMIQLLTLVTSLIAIYFSETVRISNCKGIKSWNLADIGEYGKFVICFHFQGMPL